MKDMTSNKPYLIRALYEWIVDHDLTPHLLVSVNQGGVDVPQAYVKDGLIVLNISPLSCRGLHLDNDRIVFTARFAGEAMQVALVPQTVLSIYAMENGQGMEFPEEEGPFSLPQGTRQSKSKPSLALVKNEDEQG